MLILALCYVSNAQNYYKKILTSHAYIAVISIVSIVSKFRYGFCKLPGKSSLPLERFQQPVRSEALYLVDLFPPMQSWQHVLTIIR